LPPGYPNAPNLVTYAKGGSEDDYKAHMVSKYECERWDNKLLLYIMRMEFKIMSPKRRVDIVYLFPFSLDNV